MLQPVSQLRLLFFPIAMLVPPTAVTSGSLAGASAVGAPVGEALEPSPLSPEEKYMPMPSRAAWEKTAW